MIDKIKNRKVNKEIENIKETFDETIETDNRYKEQIDKIIEQKISNSDFSLAMLSDEMNLSTGYLSRIFKQYFGVPFRDYILSERIKRSKILLLSSDKKIYEICDAVGFEDPNYFSTIFRKATGYPPNGYRKHVKND